MFLSSLPPFFSFPSPFFLPSLSSSLPYFLSFLSFLPLLFFPPSFSFCNSADYEIDVLDVMSAYHSMKMSKKLLQHALKIYICVCPLYIICKQENPCLNKNICFLYPLVTVQCSPPVVPCSEQGWHHLTYPVNHTVQKFTGIHHRWSDG